MKPLFRIELPPPKSGNKTLRTHWSSRRKKNQDWGWLLLESATKAKVKKTLTKQNPEKKRYLVFYLESCKPQDDNNFHLSIKGLVDEFQEGRTLNAIIDDSPKYCRVFYIPVRTNKKKRRMFVELYDQKDFIDRIDNDESFKKLIFSL